MLIVPLLLALPGSALALDDTPPEPAADEAPLEVGFLHATLENGLTVSILSDPRMPIVATQHWVRIGSVHEADDQRGFAHLFEHMMFSATEALPRGEYAKFHTRVGGSRNAYTTRDNTTYLSAVAPEHHDRVLEMEAERLHALVIDPEEMARDRKIVTEELRMRTENSPVSRLLVDVELSLLGDHPYARSPVGTKEDIAASTVEHARAFYEAYYRPEHIHLVIAGPVGGEATLERVRELYGGLTAGSAERPPVTPLTELTWPASVELTEDIPPVRGVALSYPLPPTNHPDHFALQLMLSMLSSDATDHFRETLVTRRKKALEAMTVTRRYRSGGALLFGSASLPLRRQRRAFALAEQTVDELGELEWNTPAALDAARRATVRGEHFGVYSAEGMARRIGYAEWYLGDVQLAFDSAARLDAVTTEDIARVWGAFIADADPTRIYVHRGPGGAE